MNRIWLTFLLIMAGLTGSAQTLSPTARITLLTCEPGDALYSTFGHSAIRVVDPLNGIDKVYNYGTFDFDTPGFYLKFMRGKLDYKLDVDGFREFDYAYRYFKRSFDEQTFNLNQQQVQAIYDYLEENYKPENRFYLYDFFFDNCATRIKDIFLDVLGDSVRLDETYTDTDKTFRDLIGEYLKGKAWTDLGIDLILGKVIDRPATAAEQTFLPDYLAKAMEGAIVVRPDGEESLVAGNVRLYDSGKIYKPTPFFLRPGVFFWPLLLVIAFLTWRGWKAGNTSFKPDGALYIIYGLAGLLIALLWFATDHTATANNLNILWALPTHLIAGGMLFRSQKPSWLKFYFLGAAVLSGIVVLGWFFLGQEFHPASFPLVMIILIRNVRLYLGLRE